MLKLSSIEDAYQYASKAEEKLESKQRKHATKVDKGKQFVYDKKFIFRGTCFKCGKDGH